MASQPLIWVPLLAVGICTVVSGYDEPLSIWTHSLSGKCLRHERHKGTEHLVIQGFPEVSGWCAAFVVVVWEAALIVSVKPVGLDILLSLQQFTWNNTNTKKNSFRKLAQDNSLKNDSLAAWRQNTKNAVDLTFNSTLTKLMNIFYSVI